MTRPGVYLHCFVELVPAPLVVPPSVSRDGAFLISAASAMLYSSPLLWQCFPHLRCFGKPSSIRCGAAISIKKLNKLKRAPPDVPCRRAVIPGQVRVARRGLELEKAKEVLAARAS